jgi:ABC-type sugar transport system ATPase subunit
MTLADRIVCLDGGRIAQVGTPDDLYTRPANVFVATFIGSPQINLFDAVAEGSRLRLADGQSLALPPGHPPFPASRPVVAGLRSEDLTDDSRLGGTRAPEPLEMRFIVSETLGSDTYLIGSVADAQVTARCAPGTRPSPGGTVRLHADTAQLHLFDPETKRRL